MEKSRFTESSQARTLQQRPSVRTQAESKNTDRVASWQWRATTNPAQEGELGSVLVSCRRTALVVAGLCEELRRARPKTEELDAMVWAAHRVIEWVLAASRNVREPSVLRYLAEAACANMALRGLAYEYAAAGSSGGHRLNGLVLAQSRKVGALLGWAAELYGRRRARQMSRRP